MYRDYIHARSIDGRHHISRDWVKNYHAAIAHEIPDDWRVCGENLWAKHSIGYDNLESFFYGFSIWNEKNECLSWADTLEWFELLEIKPVKVFYWAEYDRDEIQSLFDSGYTSESTEGYVLRLAGGFPYVDFRKSVAKYVRANHAQTRKHWFYGAKIERNKLWRETAKLTNPT